MNSHAAILAALSHRRESVDFVALGTRIGKLYTDFGLPLDIALEKLSKDYTKEQCLLVLHGACGWFMEHRRNSNAGEKALERQRRVNRKALDDFWSDRETGMY